MPRGGYRPSNPGGRPKGRKNNATLTKEQAREEVRKAIARHADALVEAQIANAKGLQYLVYRNKKTGKFERVKAVEDVNQDENTIEVWEKDPSVQAFTDLLNRYLDKPKEQSQELTITGELTLISPRLMAARKRLHVSDSR